MERSRLTNILLTTVLVIGVAVLVTQMERLKGLEKAEKAAGQPALAAGQEAAASGASGAAPALEPAPRGALEVIMSRRSVRHYTDRPIAPETLDTLLRAAMAAPTAMNRQPWSFVVVTNTALLRPLSSEWGLGMLKEAQAAVLVCGEAGNQFWQHDCSAATENLLLAAEALGLGAVWCAGYPLENRLALFKENFGLTEENPPLCLVALGYPGGDEQPKDKYKPEKIHWNRW